MPDIVIRAVAAGDLAAVRAALIETWHATYDALYGAERVREITARWHAPDILAAQASETASTFLLAERGGTVLASTFASPIATEPGVVKLWRLYVRPGEQRAGVGTRLMEATFARLPGARRHRLEVEPANAKAIAFYERHGFVRVGQVADCGGSSALRALVYERPA